MRNKVLYWSLQAGCWGLIFALNEIPTAIYSPALVLRSIPTYGLCAISGLLLSHAFRRQLRVGWLGRRAEKSLWPYLVSPFALGAIQTLFAAIFFRIFLVPDTFRRFDWVPGAVMIWTAIFVLWTALYVTVGQIRKTRQAERQKRDAELAAKDARLAALRNQVNPHFLFNSLNSIRALIYEDSAKAALMVDKLATMLRYSLRADEKRIVTLAEELEVVQEYLDIEKIRFEERLHVESQVHESALQALLPSMLIQTLVENAVKHGIERQPGGGTIRIQACMERAELHLDIYNPGTMKRSCASTKIGLSNAAQQLALSMGFGAKLTLTELDGIVRAELVIPQNGRS